ncbi:MAG: alanine--glyoxylate aminotransferase family protein [Epsilonproteobacteria bacterium]|nr:alanine--glyoxylate aminotransferase family protein [Campylobacterota bacterium]
MLLLTPGPTAVPEKIRMAMSAPTIHHRTPEFSEIFRQARQKLSKVFGMPEVLLLSSSGTGAMEASVTNLCRKKALTVNAGKFGERFGKIVKAFNLELVELKYEWNTPASVKDIEEALQNNDDIDAVFIQVCESAGGLRHPVEEIAKAVKEFNKDIVVVADGITAVGVEKVDVRDIDALISGSQKAFMLPPGLSMIGLSPLAIKKIEEKSFGYYFNLATELEKQRKDTTAWTAATTLIIGLNAMLDEIFDIGLDRFYKITKARSKASLKALEAIGFNIYPKSPAIAMSAVYNDRADEIRKILKQKYEVNIAGGQDHLKGKLFRINHMGLIKPYEASWVLNALEMILDETKVRVYNGEANRVFNEIYYKEIV